MQVRLLSVVPFKENKMTNKTEIDLSIDYTLEDLRYFRDKFNDEKNPEAKIKYQQQIDMIKESMRIKNSQ